MVGLQYVLHFLFLFLNLRSYKEPASSQSTSHQPPATSRFACLRPSDRSDPLLAADPRRVQGTHVEVQVETLGVVREVALIPPRLGRRVGVVARVGTLLLALRLG